MIWLYTLFLHLNTPENVEIINFINLSTALKEIFARDAQVNSNKQKSTKQKKRAKIACP